MPVIRAGKGPAPSWCEVENYEIITLRDGETQLYVHPQKQEHLIIIRGLMHLKTDTYLYSLQEGRQMTLDPDFQRTYELVASSGGAVVFKAVGRWRQLTNAGIVTVKKGLAPTNDTPHGYVKTTTYDNHYHDCDCYWIILAGRARVMTEDTFYDVGPGDCVATGKGWHHDVVHILEGEQLVFVSLQLALEGRRREGHLWEPTHGRALPMFDRV